jgi:phage terminase large subunit GpA-like protein
MCIHVANPERMASIAMADILQPPPPVDYLFWAEDNIVFTKRESPLPGPYNRSLFPYFDEILRALSPEDPCRIVTLSKSAQLGGTVLANIFTLGSMAMDPGDFLYVHPTDDNGRRWSKMKLSPMLRNTSCLSRFFPARSRDGSDSVMYKERSDGRGAIQISGANSPASLSQVTMQRQCQDDLAKWEINAGGDPETQADTRSQAHEFAKIFKISTPLVMPGCRITRNFELGSQEVPEVPCPHEGCGHYQLLEWDNMLSHLSEDEPEKACFYCISCGGEIRETDRTWMLSRLKWVARNPKAMREHRSFYLWSAYSLLQSWERIARSWLKAKGDPASEQTFMNDTVGLAYRVQGDAIDWQVLRDRAGEGTYVRGRIPPGALILTCGVDCQGDRVEWQVVGWGRENRRWVIEYGVIAGHISDDACREKLDKLLTWQWPNAYGRKIGIDMLAIDGNAYTEDVWGWVKKHPASRVIMVRGANRDNAPLLERVKKEFNSKGVKLKYSRRFYNFGSSTLKMSLYRNLKKTDPQERGYVGLPKGMDDEYFRMLTAERRKPQKNRSGFTEYRWVKDADQANEGLDTHLQAEAGAIRLGIRSAADTAWDGWEMERETAPPAAQFDLEDLMMSTAPPPQPVPVTEPQPVTQPPPVPASDAWVEVDEDWIHG